MSNERIIYPNQDGGIAVIVPSGDVPTIEVARKDVPEGVPYLIISKDDLPPDRMFRGAWESDFSSPDGYGVGHDAWYAELNNK